MPNRILREGILTSERVACLGWPAEVFYRRLMSVVDDFGRYYAKPELLRAAVYPLQFDKVGNPDIAKWIAVCREAGLVRTYTVEQKEYLELLDFRQQVRAKASKFPASDSINGQMRSDCVADAQRVRTETYSETYSETNAERGPRTRGTRLSIEVLPETWIAQCKEERPDLDPQKVFKAFRDYWIAVPGAKGVKLDCIATWRNWYRREAAPKLGASVATVLTTCAICRGSLTTGHIVRREGKICNACDAQR